MHHPLTLEFFSTVTVQDERDKAADEPAQEGSSSSVLDQDIDDLYVTK